MVAAAAAAADRVGAALEESLELQELRCIFGLACVLLMTSIRCLRFTRLNGEISAVSTNMIHLMGIVIISW